MLLHGPLAAGLSASVVLLCWAAPDARAQGRIAVWGAVSGVTDAPSGTLVSSYEPPLLNGTLLQSRAGQSLTLNGNTGQGLQGGINLMASRHFGIQLLVDRATVDLSGTNGAYSVSLQYASIQPPDTVARVFTTTFVKPWPDTTGSLTQWTTCFNAFARTAVAGRVSASVSGGLSWNRLSGNAESLGYTEYRLGGHSVLFPEEMHLAFELEPTNRPGFNVGGDIDIGVARHAAIVAGYRYLGAKTTRMPVRLTAILNQDDLVFRPGLDDIAQRLRIPPALMRASGSRILVGLKIIP